LRGLAGRGGGEEKNKIRGRKKKGDGGKEKGRGVSLLQDLRRRLCQ